MWLQRRRGRDAFLERFRRRKDSVLGSGSNVERVFVGYLLRRSTPGAQAEQTRGGQLSLKRRPLEGIREPALVTRDFGTGTGAGRKGSERPDSPGLGFAVGRGASAGRGAAERSEDLGPVGKGPGRRGRAGREGGRLRCRMLMSRSVWASSLVSTGDLGGPEWEGACSTGPQKARGRRQELPGWNPSK